MANKATLEVMREAARDAIVGIVPDFRGAVRFREERYHKPLAEQETLGNSGEATRTFHVFFDVLPSMDQVWRQGNGAPLWIQRIVVEIRYDVKAYDDGYLALRMFAACDMPQMLEKLYTVNWGGNYNLMRRIDLETVEGELVKVDGVDDLYILRFSAGVRYVRRDGGVPDGSTPRGEFTAEFTEEFT